jgi:hypothetical protein
VEGLGCRVRRLAAVLGAAALMLGAAACGGGGRQDADEPSGQFEVAIAQATFPARQRLAQPERLVIAVQNTGSKALPNVAVTIDSFSARSEQAGLADPEQAVWIVQLPPGGGTTANAATWALGPVQPGETRRFRWRVSPVQAGTHKLRWRVAAGLGGRAEAVLKGNRSPEGEFTVAISSRAPSSRVVPATGAVVRDGG